jgi:hypothetical protein
MRVLSLPVGKYEIQNSDTINLKNSDILKINAIDDNKIHFTFMLNAGKSGCEKAYEAKKAVPLAESAKTDLFCGKNRQHL